jgi:hypothetical protein
MGAKTVPNGLYRLYPDGHVAVTERKYALKVARRLSHSDVRKMGVTPMAYHIYYVDMQGELKCCINRKEKEKYNIPKEARQSPVPEEIPPVNINMTVEEAVDYYDRMIAQEYKPSAAISDIAGLNSTSRERVISLLKLKEVTCIIKK